MADRSRSQHLGRAPDEARDEDVSFLLLRKGRKAEGELPAGPCLSLLRWDELLDGQKSLRKPSYWCGCTRRRSADREFHASPFDGEQAPVGCARRSRRRAWRPHLSSGSWRRHRVLARTRWVACVDLHGRKAELPSPRWPPRVSSTFGGLETRPSVGCRSLARRTGGCFLWFRPSRATETLPKVLRHPRSIVCSARVSSSRE